jgi:hypothetical protein
VSSKPPLDRTAALAAVPRLLLGSSLALLVLGAVINATGRGAGGPDFLAGLATVWALVCPVLAVPLRGQGLVAPAPAGSASPEPVEVRLRRTLVFFALLESGVVLAAVALIVSPPQWPLVASLLPLAVMFLNLPRRSSGP